jgi:hypothetical protein
MSAALAVAVLRSDSGAPRGEVQISQAHGGASDTRVACRINGLTPGASLALRVLTYGDESAAGWKGCGRTFNPFHDESAPMGHISHVVIAGDGSAVVTVPSAPCLLVGPLSVIGRCCALVAEDGAIVAAGIIGIASVQTATASS